MLGDGTSQRDRQTPALLPGFVNVDELSFEELLSAAAQYSRMLKFHNLENEPEGDWEPLFTSDEAVILALILTTNLDRIEADYLQGLRLHISRFGPNYDFNELANFGLAKRIDFWLTRLQANSSAVGRSLERNIAEAIETSLGDELLSLGAFFRQYGLDVEDMLYRDFSHIWMGAGVEDWSSYPVPPPSYYPDDIERYLRRNFHSFYNAIASLKTRSARLLPESLTSGVHSPAAGLYIAFLRLFQKAQEKVNRFTQDHLDFYYNRVLQVRPRPYTPDSAFLVLSTDVPDRQVLVREGTEFTAGVDEDNQYIIYTADSDLLVHGARVDSMYTLHFEHDPQSSPENELDFASGARTSRIPVTAEGTVPDDTGIESWPLFGMGKTGEAVGLAEEASFGFALASPTLFLKEGDRSISVHFQLASRDRLDELLERLADLLPGSSPQDAFLKSFRQMFTVHLTAATGWLRVPEYLPLGRTVDERCEEDVLKFQFRLPPEAPAVVGYSSEIHGGGYDTSLPIVRFAVNPAAYLYPYSLLMNTRVQELTVEVEVQGAREVVLTNNLGPLDPSSPFYPFGPVPSVGSYLVIGNAEAARKQVTRFDVAVEWGDLPATGRDFTEYYQGYGLPFSNHIFEAQVSALRDGRWQPAEETRQERVKLFQEAEGTSASSGGWHSIKYNRWSLGDEVTRFFTPVPGMSPQEGLVYSALSKDGFFKFTLSRPEYAFGHKDYPTKLASVLFANARIKKAELALPVPNPPYTPLVNSVSVDYRAVSSLNLEQVASSPEEATPERVFHIHPFGIEAIPPGDYRDLNLVPRYHPAGNLFIGISARSLPGPLTLFFHLREDCASEAAEQDLGITWHYLASNQWRPLDRSRVISDTTSGFLTSGIVTLDLPGDINRDNTIMPGNLYWLCVSVDNHPEALCSLYSVHTQALKVTWRHREGSSARPHQQLLPGTIREPRVSIPGIAGVNQVVQSFGGSPPETPSRTMTRTSERLRHKNRAVTPWDYERLILERFPDIFKVKCFTNLVAASGQEGVARPGCISIVVIPDPKLDPTLHLKPLVNGLMLQEIQDYVSAHASPFTAIMVRNPAYEEIQVRCTVKFREGAGEGYYIRALNLAIFDYISPWSDSGGYGARFGWTMRRHDIESYIRGLEYVEFVTNFSMLRVSVDGQGYSRLFDTATADAEVDEVHPLYPWSIAVPVRRHFIETTQRYQVIPPEPTGIDELEIGSTFIVTEK